MAPKTIGINRKPFKEHPNQFSAHSTIELKSSCSLLNYHLRNLYPKILAEPFKKVKSWKIVESLSFLKSGIGAECSKSLVNIYLAVPPQKKIQNLTSQAIIL